MAVLLPVPFSSLSRCTMERITFAIFVNLPPFIKSGFKISSGVKEVLLWSASDIVPSTRSD